MLLQRSQIIELKQERCSLPAQVRARGGSAGRASPSLSGLPLHDRGGCSRVWSAVQPAERRKRKAEAECLPFKPGHTLPLTLWLQCGHNPREPERCPLSLAKAVAQLKLPLSGKEERRGRRGHWLSLPCAGTTLQSPTTGSESFLVTYY